MEFNFWLFVLDNLEAAGAIGGYVSLSIIGFALFTYVSKKSSIKYRHTLDLNICILLLVLLWGQFQDVEQQLL